MVAPVSETAFAKINLHLKVGGKRADGYHEIESLFQQISIADFVSVRVAEVLSIRCVGFDLPAENSLKKAYEVFCRASGFRKAVEVLLMKNIPVAAGLGGASTDAVALLKALNRLSGAGFSETRLEELALEIGSDCPFFVKGGTAFVRGRGEKLEALKGVSGLGLLVFPEVESKTERAYSLLGRKQAEKARGTGLRKKAEILRQYRFEAFSKWAETGLFVNDFEKVIFENHPAVLDAKKALLKAGADFALMSGSGSSVFGLFQDAKSLEWAKAGLEKDYKFCEPFIFM